MKALATSYDFEKEQEPIDEFSIFINGRKYIADGIKPFVVLPVEDFYTEDRERMEERGE